MSIHGGLMQHFFRDVPRLGNVAVSRHAQERMVEQGISEQRFIKALLEPLGEDIPEAPGILWREREGLRIVVITNPTPNRGAKLVKTVYLIQGQANARR